MANTKQSVFRRRLKPYLGILLLETSSICNAASTTMSWQLSYQLSIMVFHKYIFNFKVSTLASFRFAYWITCPHCANEGDIRLSACSAQNGSSTAASVEIFDLL